MDTATAVMLLVALLLGAALGALAMALRRDQGGAAQAAQTQALMASLEVPLADMRARLAAADESRGHGMGRIEEQLRAMAEGHRTVAQQTASVVAALRNPGVRGRWGEVQLTRIVESAGLLEGVTFRAQSGADGGRLRPDMVIDLGEGRRVVVDSKVPLDALLAAYEDAAGEPDVEALRAHAAAVRGRVKELAGKEYQTQLAASADFVVLFLPSESLLSTALAADPTLTDDAYAAGVVLATPTTLLTLLRIVALTWRETRARENAEEMLDMAAVVIDRVGVLAGHLQVLGKRLDAAMDAYNSVAGTWQARVRPTARRLGEFGAHKSEIAELAALDASARQVDRLPDTA